MSETKEGCTCSCECDLTEMYSKSLLRGRYLYQRQLLFPQLLEMQERCRKVENLLCTDYAAVPAAFDQLKNLIDALTDNVETELQQEGDQE